MDYLDFLLFILGTVTGYFLREPEQVEKVIATSHGPERVYARFCFGDGRVEVRPFKPTDLHQLITWKDKTFAKGEWTPDGYVYKETLNG